MSFRYVDSHCHVDAYPELLQVMDRAQAAETVVVAMTQLPSDHQRLTTLIGRRSALRIAVGMHPLRSRQVTATERQLLQQQLRRTMYVGEIGLDYTVDEPERHRQRDNLAFVLEQAAATHVLSIHSRRAPADTIAAIRHAQAVAPVLHWYSGPTNLVEEALEAGCYFSVNSAMTRSRKGKSLIAMLPRDRVLTETDGPYTRLGSRDAEPADVPSIIDDLSNQWNTEHELARAQVWNNMISLAARLPAPTQS